MIINILDYQDEPNDFLVEITKFYCEQHQNLLNNYETNSKTLCFIKS